MEPFINYHASEAEVSREFNHFFNEKLRPIIDSVAARRRRALFRGLAAAGVLFVVGAVALHFYLAPKLAILKNHDIAFWPLFFLLPGTLALLVFSLTYILSLRNMVGDFKASMLARMAEFIHPSLIHESGNAIPDGDLEASLLFDALGKPSGTKDRFRGGLGFAKTEFSAVRVELPEDRGHKRRLYGIFYVAAFARRFKSPLLALPILVPTNLPRIQRKLEAAGLARQGEPVRVEDAQDGLQAIVYESDKDEVWRVLTPDLKVRLATLRARRGVDVYVSCLGDRFSLALLAPEPPEKRNAALDDFDFANYREFSRDARLCIGLTRELDADPEVWE